MRLLFITLGCFLLWACASNVLPSNPRLAGWNRENVMKLTEEWGRPTRITTAFNGNWEYVYTKPATGIKQNDIKTETFVTPKGTLGVNLPANRTGLQSGLYCTTIFEVNPRNIIVTVRQEGTCRQ